MARKLDYGIDGSVDLFTSLAWPSAFLEDPSYALLRPLYDFTSPWRASHEALSMYLHAQARRLGGRRRLFHRLASLALISEGYPEFNRFLRSPLGAEHRLRRVFIEMTGFLRWRFDCFPNDPWAGYPLPEQKSPATEAGRLHLVRTLLATTPRRQGPPKAPFAEDALRECPGLDAVRAEHLFAPPVPSLGIVLGGEGFAACRIPVVLGRHYLEKEAQRRWFEGRRLYRVLGCWARWDDADVAVFRHDVDAAEMFSSISREKGLRPVGACKRAQADGIDYYLSLLIDSGLQEKLFFVQDWQINCPQLTILAKDTDHADDRHHKPGQADAGTEGAV